MIQIYNKFFLIAYTNKYVFWNYVVMSFNANLDNTELPEPNNDSLIVAGDVWYKGNKLKVE